MEIVTYLAELKVQDNEVLSFNFIVETPTKLKIFNVNEVIEITDVVNKNDSVYITTPVFEGYLSGSFDGKNLKCNYKR